MWLLIFLKFNEMCRIEQDFFSNMQRDAHASDYHYLNICIALFSYQMPVKYIEDHWMCTQWEGEPNTVFNHGWPKNVAARSSSTVIHRSR